MLGTEKCGNVRGEIAAELCHQGIGISFATCCKNYHSGKWYKDARESEDNSTIIHANKSNKKMEANHPLRKSHRRGKVLDTVYLDESKSFRIKDAE
jgi:hypothetical protein